MWQLDLLARVVPAFGALAKQFYESDCHDTKLVRDAEDCHNDIVLIGQAIYISGGEWAVGLDDIDLTKLLTALETRFPTKWRVLPSLMDFNPWKSQKVSPPIMNYHSLLLIPAPGSRYWW
jgi:hypothetical protein